MKMTNSERGIIFERIRYEISKIIPDDMTDTEYFEMYSKIAMYFAKRMKEYFEDFVDEKKERDG